MAFVFNPFTGTLDIVDAPSLHLDQTTPQTVINGPVDVTGKETHYTVGDVGAITLTPTYPTQNTFTVNDTYDTGSYLDYSAGSFMYASDYFVVYAYKTAPDSTRVFCASPAYMSLGDYSGTPFQYAIQWADASADGYIVQSYYNGYYIDVGNVLSLVVPDYSAWSYGYPSTSPTSPYYTYTANGSLTMNQGWSIYAKNDYGAVQVYSVNASSTTDADPYYSGAGWTEQLSWGAVTGATSYIIHNTILNYWIETTNLGVTDDGTATGWSSGAPTVTPTPYSTYADMFHGHNSIADFKVDGAGNVTAQNIVVGDGTTPSLGFTEKILVKSSTDAARIALASPSFSDMMFVNPTVTDGAWVWEFGSRNDTYFSPQPNAFCFLADILSGSSHAYYRVPIIINQDGSIVLQAATNATNGNVLIGTTTDDATNKLQVNGTVKVTSLTETTPTLRTIGEPFSIQIRMPTSAYATSVYINILDMTRGTAAFPHGLEINSIYVDSDRAAPTTQFAGALKYCDSPGTGSFPGASVVSIATITTTTGNYSSTGRTDSVANGKVLYIQMTADPVDANSVWFITINGHKKTS